MSPIRTQSYDSVLPRTHSCQSLVRRQVVVGAAADVKYSIHISCREAEEVGAWATVTETYCSNYSH
jgi:hypothetical protein